ncbi:APC family permease [Amycolatopsis vancoresmycina]|uniref:Amino acid/polyamine/organocation transporter, APC superfamily protein n=1 Tax=Amycolatopsis vancoresmycina DSM 44592 TaxID=1292037 RepID=R1HVR1_9PSEU|nr:APC family permease [Amycolatopsis vancoresmycina]EOD67640.1 amino acid/polyamine/organocation transporter, APC superfamily protein [Amycolatopsis vancoresmycina DSM 44592]
MPAPTSWLKRLVVGRPFRSDTLGETLLPKWLALPIFASDPLSSVAYATQEILLILSIGGLAYLTLAPWVGLAVAVLLTVVVISYRQVVRAYPSGGGSYEVASRNLGSRAGLVVAGALMVDYIMTVAVSVASGVDNIISAVPELNDYRIALNIGFIVLLMAMNLRGIRESGRAFAAPTYLFIATVMLLVVVGLGRTFTGHAPVAESAGYDVRPEQVGLTGAALVFLLLRSFASGCTALTGVEAISNGVPAFRKPKALNAARTMTAMGVTAVVMFGGITALALITKVHIAENTCDLAGFRGDCATDPQRTVISQIGAAVFGGDHTVLFYILQAATALILILAANTAFNGFPLLASILAQDRYLPRQLHTRGDRLAFSNGIIALSLVAGILIFAFDGSTTRLIQLYILGVFTSFTLCQAGMVRHWNRVLAGPTDSRERRAAQRSRLINALGALLTALVLIVVLITKFTHGAYLVVIAIPALYLLMRAIHRHYTHVREELRPDDEFELLPSRVHAIVLVSTLHKPSQRAIAFARATRPDTLSAITVNVDDADTRELQHQWEQRGMKLPLKVIESPYREITRPVVQYVKNLRRGSPRDVVCIYIPEYVVGRWWENILHNQSSLRLKGRLLFEPGVMVTSVPWQLHSTTRRDLQRVRPLPGDLRRGVTTQRRSG